MSREPIRKGQYGRLLVTTTYPLNTKDGEARLKCLAYAMTDKGNTDNSSIPAGFTYFGQFIDHDLTWNRDRLAPQQLDDVPIESAPIDNFRTSFLDLDHVYGDGPGSPNSQAIYRGEAGQERFKIGRTLPSASPSFNLDGRTPNDLEFEGDLPLMGDGFDHRNAENLIVRQLHVVFLKFHNAVIAQSSELENFPDETFGTLFRRTHLFVKWTYQWIVWHEFLATLLESSIWRKPLQVDSALCGLPYDLPMEFPLAAFRFGHSMVRDKYPLNQYHQSIAGRDTEMTLKELINTHEKHASRLEEQFVIEWDRFFPPGNMVPARKIDTHITDVMRDLPEGMILRFSRGIHGKEIHNLAFRTLLRGARARLPSGQEYQTEKDTKLATVLASDEPLRDTSLTEDTPLWYYILKEAEFGDGDQNIAGERLGRVGSWIVRNAIEGALQHDETSYLNTVGPQWSPPDRIINTERGSNIFSLIKFAENFAG